MSARTSTPHIAILLATYNGAHHLPEQLDSIIAQTHTDWTIHVSDDGSTDDTLAILLTYRERLGADRMVLWQGPRAGYSRNFMSMLHREGIDGDYVAFSDQDDIWDMDKLEKALAAIVAAGQEQAALYGGRSRLVDEAGKPFGMSPLFARRPSFANALVQSLAGGNTMLINRRARALMCRAPETAKVVSHDWWAYLVVSGAGGLVVYDREPTIGYRQHAENIIGSNAGFGARLRRMADMVGGRHREWNDFNVELLAGMRDDLSDENRQRFDRFVAGRSGWLLPRAWNFARAGLYRQTAIGNAGLVLAALLGRL
ncbi:MAG: glycosyltransferase family 2 protein [Luteibacter sp.]|uniref:glycosyltransferase family 2 protein n=1 Tax=Luteibacter sp. TaxID=1886636 RepID=UPI00280713DE|nr:glycosyltransferase family 2 protein [Luteibacter sp.]MDQ7996445.1 glycosyltransferase family 2 protein [Luteibacter sp.]MDQ8047927.1 glycosyltransferase family 2 protein [Luteibacter sp.]